MKAETVLTEFLVKVRDAANEALDQLTPTEAKHDAKDFDKLNWSEKQGTKGAYQQTGKEANNNSELFGDLQKILGDHKGFCVIGDYKYWSFSKNPDVVGRRKK